MTINIISLENTPLEPQSVYMISIEYTVVIMKGMAKVSRLWDPDLIWEMIVDLGSIFCGLYLINHIGKMMIQDGWYSLWIWMVSLANGDAHLMYVFGNLLVLLIVYWVPAALFTLADILQPSMIYQYKVQKEKAQVILNFEILAKVVIKVTTNQIVQTLIGSEIAWRWRYQYINMDLPLHEVPSFKRLNHLVNDNLYQNQFYF